MARNMKGKRNLLFVCAGNINRSPTFEIWFKNNRPQYNVKSSGTEHGYPERLTSELLEWADRVYVMDREQIMFFKRKFPEFLNKVEIIGCSDQYDREEPRLFWLIEDWAKEKEL